MARISQGEKEPIVTSLFLPTRISKEDAVRIFWRPAFGNLYGLWKPTPVRRTPDGRPDSIELAWMPAFAFRLALSKGAVQGCSWVSVDASFGGFALFERVEILQEGVEEENCFPSVLPENRAEHLARQGMLRYVLRRRGVKPLIGATEETRLYYAPVWVFYYYRMGKKIDLKVIDGYTGGPMGGQMKVAIVNALIKKRSEKLST